MIQRIKDIIIENKSNFGRIIKFRYNNLFNEINTTIEGKTFSEKLYKWINSNFDNKCKECNNETKFIGINNGFRLF